MHFNRYRAFLLHLSLSALIFLTVVALAARFWYPDLYFKGAGVWQALRMVVLVDVGLGPLMTLILFRPGKPGLKFDLTVVAVVQVLALLYGVHILYKERPVLTAFHEGMFVCLNPGQAAFAGVDPEQFRQPGFAVPMAVLPPFSAAEKAEWLQRQESLPEGYPKHPAYVYGDRMTPYRGEALAMVMEDDWDISQQLRLDPDDRVEYERYMAGLPQGAQRRFFVFTCGLHQYMVAVDPASGRPDALLDISFVNAQRRAVQRMAAQKRGQPDV